MVVDSSNHDPGEKARLQLPTMKENDTHCIDFSYLLYSQKGLNPGTLNILVRVNKGPLANPIWNVTGFTGRDWLRAELAVSTFWPNEYQVILWDFLLCAFLYQVSLYMGNIDINTSSAIVGLLPTMFPSSSFLKRSLDTLAQNLLTRDSIFMHRKAVSQPIIPCLLDKGLLTPHSDTHFYVSVQEAIVFCFSIRLQYSVWIGFLISWK